LLIERAIIAVRRSLASWSRISCPFTQRQSLKIGKQRKFILQLSTHGSKTADGVRIYDYFMQCLSGDAS